MEEQREKFEEIVKETKELLGKTGLDAFVSVPGEQVNSSLSLETTLSDLKTINARYDKTGAVAQVRCLMEKYNIQLDELAQISSV